MSNDPKSLLPALAKAGEALGVVQHHLQQLARDSATFIKRNHGGEFVLPNPLLYGRPNTGLEQFESFVSIKVVNDFLMLTNFYGEHFPLNAVCMSHVYMALRQLVTTTIASAEMVGKTVTVYDPGTGTTRQGKLLSLNPTKVQDGNEVFECAHGSVVVALNTDGAS